MPMHRQPEPDLGGPDMSWIVPLAVMTVVVVIGLGVLMAVAHRSEGWPIIAFLAKPAAPVAAAIQLGLGGVAGAIGVTYARRGYRHWRGELSGGIPSALFGAVIAVAALFAAIELISAAW